MNEFDDLFTDEDIATEGLFGKMFNKHKSNNSILQNTYENIFDYYRDAMAGKFENAFLTELYTPETAEELSQYKAAIEVARKTAQKAINNVCSRYNISKDVFFIPSYNTGNMNAGHVVVFAASEGMLFNYASKLSQTNISRLDSAGINIPNDMENTMKPEAKRACQLVQIIYNDIITSLENYRNIVYPDLWISGYDAYILIEIYWKNAGAANESISSYKEEFNMNEYDSLFTDDDIANEAIGDKKTRVFQVTAADKKRCITACKAAKAALKRDIPIIADKYGFSPKDVEISKDLNTTSINAISADKLIFNLFSFDTSVKGLTIGHTKIFNNVKKAIKDACPMMEVKPDPRGKSYIVYMEYTPTGKDVTKQYKKDAGMESIDASFDGIFDDFAFESVATNLKRDLQDDPEEAMSLKSMYNVYMNEDALKKYEEKYDQLKHINKNAENLRGHMYFMNGELVAFVSVEYKSGKTWIDTLEVVKKFRGNKLSFQLLDVAVRKFHATDLRVNKDNEKAIGIFKTYGFKTYDHKGNWLYMTLRADAKEIENKETEKAQPVTANLKSDTIKEAKQQSANEAAMDVEGFDEFLMMCLESANGIKSVDDLLDEAKVTLNKKLKTVDDCEAYLEVIKNESAKFNEACSCLISAYAKYNHSKKERADTIELKKTTSAAILLLNQNCRALNVRLGDIAHKDGEEISRNDIKRFGQYVAGLRKITNEIKDARKKGIALEYTLPDDEIDDADMVLESAAAAEEFFEFMDSEDAEPAQEQSDSYSYDDEDWDTL